MRRFNPERELYKIQHGNKNKVIFGIFLLLIILGISSSYALYQVRYSKRIIYTKVAPFSNNDIDLAVLVDGKSEDDFPEKDAGKIYDKIDCGKTNVKAYWDYDKWALVLETSKKAKCTVYFKTGTDSEGNKIDTSGANPPELYDGLIPIKYGNNGEIIVADPKATDWYNYEEKRWANAVLINNKGFAADLSGNGNHGEFVGGAQITDEGLVLDGVDDGIFLDDKVKDMFKHDNTFQIKFKKNNSIKSILIGNFSTSSSFVNNYEAIADNKLRFWYNDGRPDFTTPNSADVNSLITLTYLFDSTNEKITIYQNETKLYESDNKAFTRTTIDYLSVYIGRDNSQPCSINGTIEKVMIYDDMLTEEEIQRNLNAPSGKVGNGGIVDDNLHLYYDFKVPQTVDTTPGEILSIDAISQMYVWIPRYKYQLFNAIAGNISDERMINIKFENGIQSTGGVTCKIDEIGKETCENAINGNWYTHPAFTFGDTELSGIWFGKFESSNNLNNIEILPNKDPIRYVNIFSMFDGTRNIEKVNSTKYGLDSNQIDTHVLKNSEWGAMAYLTQSKYGRCDNNGNCTEVTMNNKEYRTGYDNTGSLWNTEKGTTASTTGNMYGIYDTNGDVWDSVMANMVKSDGKFYSSGSGFPDNDPKIDKKYYELYQYEGGIENYKRGHLGDATWETRKELGGTGWYGDYSTFVNSNYPWLTRGGQPQDRNLCGIFAFWSNNGNNSIVYNGLRVVLTAQDGNE